VTEPRDLWLEVIEEMEARRQKGLKEYGVPVTGEDAVDWLRHAESEFFDGGIYCRAARVVMERLQARVRELEEQVDNLKDRIEDMREYYLLGRRASLEAAMEEGVAQLHQVIEEGVKNQGRK
jgi:hypothetical protein